MYTFVCSPIKYTIMEVKDLKRSGLTALEGNAYKILCRIQQMKVGDISATIAELELLELEVKVHIKSIVEERVREQDIREVMFTVANKL